MSLRIWVDADACPKAIKEVLYRAADRRQVPMTLIANQFLRTPPSKYIDSVQVEGGFDVADNAILARMRPGDLVVTQDIPLANEVIDKGGSALNPRGTVYTRDNIKDHLARRDMLEELRGAGVMTGGPPALEKRDVQQFANALDRLLTRALADQRA